MLIIKENNSIIYMLKDKNDKTIKTLKLIETFPENVISSNKSEDPKVQAVKKFISACQKMDFNTILTLVSRGNFVFENKFDIVNDIYIYIKYLETRGYSLYNLGKNRYKWGKPKIKDEYTIVIYGESRYSHTSVYATFTFNDFGKIRKILLEDYK